MLEAEEIAEAMESFFVAKTLAGRRVLMTAGPTFEPIDPVRGITNLSSGRMGFAIARACVQAGARVTVVAGPVSLATPAGVARIDVTSAEQMFRAVTSELDLARGNSSGYDAFIAVAAVADWRVAKPSARKLKKTDAGEAPALEFVQNPDILAEVARRPDAPYCVGFAAESEDLEAHGSAKRLRKGVPLLVANIGHETFGRDDNELLLIDAKGSRRLARASKDALAATLAAELAARLGGRG
jgi:phosphopantothenoylcysteine decarboxylase/phosphopantothenate--cysteine ligase